MNNLQDNDGIFMKISGISKRFFRRSAFNWNQYIDAVSDISFNILKGETIGVIGESGSGKSTLGKIIINILKSDKGKVIYKEQDILAMSDRKFYPFRKDLQMVFQNPYASLNNRYTVKEILAEGLRVHKICNKYEEQDIIDYLLDLVGLNPKEKNKRSCELSGGQCQRIGIARSLSVEPKFIVFDESTSALDVIVQDQIIKMIKDIQKKMELTYLFISHNLNLVKEISDKVCVINSGKVVEFGYSNMININNMA